MGTLPTSPRKILAGCQFQSRKPRDAPASPRPSGPSPAGAAPSNASRNVPSPRLAPLDTADPVDSVHEVEQVHEPEPGQRRQRVIDEGRNGALKYQPLAGERRDPGADGGDLREQPRQGGEAAAQIVEPGHRREPQRAGEHHPEQALADRAGAPQPEREPGCEQNADDGDAAAARYRLPVAGALVGAVHYAVALQQPAREAGQNRGRRQARAARGEGRREAHRARPGAASAGRPCSVMPKIAHSRCTATGESARLPDAPHARRDSGFGGSWRQRLCGGYGMAAAGAI